VAPAAVQRIGKGVNAASITIASGDGWATPTSGNLLVVSANSDATVTGPTGAGSWTAGPSIVDGNGTYTWYKISNGTETSITCTPSVSDKIAMTACEYSGVSGTPFDVSNSSTIASVSGSATTSTSVTTTAAGDLVVAFALLHGTLGGTIAVPTSPAWTNSFVQQLTASTAGTADADCFTFVGELVVGAAGAYATSCSWTNNRADRQEIVLAFKASAGGATLNADATETVTATVSPTAAVSRAASATETVTATVSPTAAVDRAASATETVTATVSPTAAVDRAASASLTVTATITATASIAGQQNIDATKTITATVSPTAAVDRPTSVTGPTATATITTAAAVDRAASSSQTATATITATAAVVRNAQAALTVTATISPVSQDTTRNATTVTTVTARGASTATVTARAVSTATVSEG
jgi:hypothetical protein